MKGFDFSNWGPLHKELEKEFPNGATWPVSERILHALVTLGMSDSTIADYFGVDADEVAGLRENYAIPDREALSRAYREESKPA